jgi:aspartate 1-decarboxylase
LIKKDHNIIITTFGLMTEEELKKHKPKIIILDENNKVIECK